MSGLRHATLSLPLLLLACARGGEEPRIAFERFTLDANGNLDAVFRIENRSPAPIEVRSQGSWVQWFKEVPDPSEEDGWGEPEFQVLGCGNGLGWTTIPAGAAERRSTGLFDVEGESFRMNLPARRPSLLHLVDLDVGQFELLSDEVPFPRSLDAVGEDVDVADDDLFRAAFLGGVASVRDLLDAGVPAERPDDETGATPLHAAAARGNVDVIRLLIARSAPIDALAVYGRTPLWWALFQGQVEATEVLLRAGADPDHHQDGSMTPLAYAEREHLEEIASLLRDAGARR